MLARCAAAWLLIPLSGCSLFVESALSDKPSESASSTGATAGGSGGSASSENTGASTTGTSAGASLGTAGGSSGACEDCGAAACCSDKCVDLLTSAANCGACGVVCSGGRACVDGACGPSWVAMPSAGEPAPRHQAAAVWTSSGMFVWGGRGASNDLSDGAIFDPILGAWTPVAQSGAPSARTRAAVVWTGSIAIVWGGGPFQSPVTFADGGRYSPSKQEWLSVSPPTSGAGRKAPIAAWTGSRMLIWGGTSGSNLVDGGASYDPVSDTWSEMSKANAPGARSGVAAAWSGTELLIFGGRSPGLSATSEGYAYDPSSDQWRALPSTGAPEARYDAFALWMNGQLLVWGGRNDKDQDIDTAARYDPSKDTWFSVPSSGPSTKRSSPAGQTGWSAWTGQRALFVGGRVGNGMTTDALEYDPTSDDWQKPLDSWPGGKAHEYAAAAWSGTEFFLWSGRDSGAVFAGGESLQP